MIQSGFRIGDDFIKAHNDARKDHLRRDYESLGEQLERRGVGIDKITEQAAAFVVALPSWGVGTGGTRFGRFPGIGEPRNVFEKMADCATIHQLIPRHPPRRGPHPVGHS